MSEPSLVALLEPLIFNEILEDSCIKTITYNGYKMSVDMCKILGECKHKN